MPNRSTRARSRIASTFALTCAASQIACNALDDPTLTRNRRIVPTDTRPAIQTDTPPPPLSGGTLTITRDGRFAAVADEARDRLSVVDLTERAWLGDVTFAAGSRPGRVVEGEPGTVHVVLRNVSAVARVSLSDRAVVSQTEVCAAPRGIAFVAESKELLVACASGRLLTLAEDGELVRTIQLPNDLRDVVVERGNVWVSRFRSAEVMRLDAAGNIAERLRAPSLTLSRMRPDFSQSFVPFEPNVGWRLTANPSGGVALVHQRATTEELDLTAPESSSSSPYGGSGASGCADGIARSSITLFDVDGVVTPGPNPAVSLPVDVALTREGTAVVVGAGREDFDAPHSQFVSVGDGFVSSSPSFRSSSDMVISSLTLEPGGGCSFDRGFNVDDGSGEQYVVSVAVQPLVASGYVVQMREPAQLVIVTDAGTTIPIALGGDSVADTGFDLFHRNAEAGISCASCHPDGTDDGHVWNFQGHGLRRTQPIDVGLDGTAPFHWDGSLRAVGDLMGEVFVARMGGVHQTPERLDLLERWLFELTAPTPELPLDETRVDRGRSLFQSLEIGCADCHRGESFTDNNNYDVGTGAPGEKFQVPSLIGVGTRSRLMHDGCANSLSERFELPCAGGDRHGKVSLLEPNETSDLIAYLETL